ncbi:DUF2061 domain-containing protein [Tenacibaculum jejuense]|uniref:DUF2061 domain-containing protein n=1 Tax=Tenacibaculum jejuense TaxID=584609 RepID=A0A238UDA3_9FLAO|nr:DUF2061 domain-containing protein [Tenacibaculum jejuense]SNR17173.1 conserved protein of unknown function [Tenacibaculum jejuense]
MIIEQVIEDKSNFKEDRYSEKPIRSIIKSISWRAVGTIDTIVISWLITGEVDTALSIGGIELVTKMLLYFFHERVWNSIKWGRK